jgi:nitroreductase
MDMLELIKSRRSIRRFEKRMPEKELIMKCLEAATWAPSATNQQPWEFIVLTGTALEKVNLINQENFAERMQSLDPFSGLPEEYGKRQQDIFRANIEAAEKDGFDPKDYLEKTLRFCDAPAAVYFVTHKRDDNQYVLSNAAAIENFLLAATAQGLGTCWLSVVIVCQQDVKEHLRISPEKELIAGIAVGYPATDSAFNTFDRTRVPADQITIWLE